MDSSGRWSENAGAYRPHSAAAQRGDTAVTEVAWPEDAVLDPVIGQWSLWQRRRGHRTSTDDLLTAWMAVHASGARRPSRYLDLGCGIGSVLCMTAWRLRPEFTLGVEAQAQSALMAVRSFGGLPDAVDIRVVNSDFRSCADIAPRSFDLVTGSPPYLPVGTGIESPDPQRRACRFEIRGGVEAYCETAAMAMTPDAVFSLVFQTVWDDRVLAAAAGAGLRLRSRADIRTRVGRPGPFLTVYAFDLQTSGDVERIELDVRDAEGRTTSEWNALRAELGLGVQA
jgi:tRNA1(Val) A37 N6-methylase TrmN6